MEKKGFIQSERGFHITNLPETSCSNETYQTGHYNIDYYGCWWECHDKNNDGKFWMIGEYPAEFYDEIFAGNQV